MRTGGSPGRSGSFSCCCGTEPVRRERRRRSAVAHAERGDEGRLRDLDLAELAHPLFALLLLFEELAFAGHVAAIAFGEHVLAQRLDGLPRDDPAADRRLDRDLKELARDQILQSLAQRTA